MGATKKQSVDMPAPSKKLAFLTGLMQGLQQRVKTEQAAEAQEQAAKAKRYEALLPYLYAKPGETARLAQQREEFGVTAGFDLSRLGLETRRVETTEAAQAFREERAPIEDQLKLDMAEAERGLSVWLFQQGLAKTRESDRYKAGVQEKLQTQAETAAAARSTAIRDSVEEVARLDRDLRDRLATAPGRPSWADEQTVRSYQSLLNTMPGLLPALYMFADDRDAMMGILKPYMDLVKTGYQKADDIIKKMGGPGAIPPLEITEKVTPRWWPLPPKREAEVKPVERPAAGFRIDEYISTLKGAGITAPLSPAQRELMKADGFSDEEIDRIENGLR